MNDSYRSFADFYDCLMSDVDYPGLADYFHDLIGNSGGILLDLACGTGTLSVLMAQRGWDVIGVDSCHEMLSRAKAHEQVSYICQDMTKLDLFGTIDAAICSLDGLNHLADESELLRVLERVSLFMNPDGALVFDLNTIYKHETILSNNIFVKECDGVYCVWKNFYCEDGVVEIVLDIFAGNAGDTDYTRHTVEIREKAYALGMVRKLCERAGFSIVGIYDFMKKTTANENSEKVVFVCRKNQQ